MFPKCSVRRIMISVMQLFFKDIPSTSRSRPTTTIRQSIAVKMFVRERVWHRHGLNQICYFSFASKNIRFLDTQKIIQIDTNISIQFSSHKINWIFQLEKKKITFVEHTSYGNTSNYNIWFREDNMAFQNRPTTVLLYNGYW